MSCVKKQIGGLSHSMECGSSKKEEEKKAYKGPQGNLHVNDLFTTRIVMRFHKCIHTSKLTKLYTKTGLLSKHSPIKTTLSGNCYLINFNYTQVKKSHAFLLLLNYKLSFTKLHRFLHPSLKMVHVLMKPEVFLQSD